MENSISKKFSGFSVEVRELLASELTMYYIDRLNTQNKIPADKEGVIAQLIAKLVLGMVPAQEFTLTAQKELSVDSQTAARISREVRDVMLAPIQKQLLKEANLDLKKIKTDTAQPSAAPVARTTQMSTNPLTTVNLKQATKPTVTPVQKTDAPATGARVIQFKAAPAKEAEKQKSQDPGKKMRVTDAESPFTLKEEPPQG